jgi:hypothetical protein
MLLFSHRSYGHGCLSWSAPHLLPLRTYTTQCTNHRNSVYDFTVSYPCTVKSRGLKNRFYDDCQHLPDKAEILGLSFIIKYHNTLQRFSQDSKCCRCYRHFVRRILENAEYQWLPDDLPMSDKQTLGAYFTFTFTLWKSTVLTLLRNSTDRHRAPFPSSTDERTTISRNPRRTKETFREGDCNGYEPF